MVAAASVRPDALVRRAAAIALALAVAAAACDPAPSPAATAAPPTPGAIPTAPSTITPAPSPTATPSPTTPAATASPAPTVGPVAIQFLDREHSPGGVLRSDDGQVLWTSGARFPRSIWRYVPGAAAPELICTVPRTGSVVSDVVAGAAGYAFVETNDAEFGKGGWRVWFVAGPRAAAIEVDRGIAYGAGFPPTLAMDDERLAWAAFDEPPSGDISVLRVAPVDDLAAKETVLELPVRDGLLWLPELNGDELWYAIIHADFDGSSGGDEFHVETLDLGSPGSAPVRFPGTANDFSPVANDRYVVWKTAVDDGAALNWGTLTVLDRSTSERRVVPVDDLNDPSLGSRFLTFEEISRERLLVYDLARGEIVELLSADLNAGSAVGGQSIDGSLLTFFTQTEGSLPRIGWAILPE